MFYAEKPEFAPAFPLIPKSTFNFTIHSEGAEDLLEHVFVGKIIDPVMASTALSEGVLEFAGEEFNAGEVRKGRYTTSLIDHSLDFEFTYGRRNRQVLCIPGKVLVYTPTFNGAFATTYRPDFFAHKLSTNEFRLA